ncbi:hypothetical protein [Mesorhizobium amorphae]|uniref:hypothetical protein n=1 Tax=Mesorhizobium amorphae TaxID=71433 RepID=UPI0024E06C71|nr:hypothetical protein [Mesorhizobium amorphae]
MGRLFQGQNLIPGASCSIPARCRLSHPQYATSRLGQCPSLSISDVGENAAAYVVKSDHQPGDHGRHGRPAATDGGDVRCFRSAFNA